VNGACARGAVGRFLNGVSIDHLAKYYEVTREDIEQCLRRHLERLLAKKNGRKR
jgi:uncharacterized protein (DUF433 family)